jgi:hypothetical protein
LQHREELVEPGALVERPGDPLVRFPLGELSRVDPREQLFGRAPKRER